MDKKIISVVHFQRKKALLVFSLERLFEDLRFESKNFSLFDISLRFNKFRSRGILRRLIDSFLAIFHQKDINHITGDVHYLSFFLNTKKTIITIHDCGILKKSKGIKYLFLLIFWYLIPEKKSSIITVISNSMKQELLSFINCDPDKIRVIHNMVSPEFKKNNKLFNKDNPKIIHLGSTSNKNLKNHIKALKGIKCKFIIIGLPKKEELYYLDKFNIDYSIFSNLTRKELLKKYNESDILLFASLYEGFGLPIIEAQSIGRIVITSNCAPMNEIAGGGACLVDPTNYISIRKGIKKVINNKNFREQLLKKGFKNIQNFSASKISKEYLNLYEEIYNKNWQNKLN